MANDRLKIANDRTELESYSQDLITQADQIEKENIKLDQKKLEHEKELNELKEMKKSIVMEMENGSIFEKNKNPIICDRIFRQL